MKRILAKEFKRQIKGKKKVVERRRAAGDHCISDTSTYTDSSSDSSGAFVTEDKDLSVVESSITKWRRTRPLSQGNSTTNERMLSGSDVGQREGPMRGSNRRAGQRSVAVDADVIIIDGSDEDEVGGGVDSTDGLIQIREPLGKRQRTN